MTPGEKVAMRVKPGELMACVDVLEAAGVSVSGMSLSSMVRCALNILVQSAIDAGSIPKRDGFDYNERIAPFKRANLRTKVQIGRTISMAEKYRAGDDATVALGRLPTPLEPLEISEGERSARLAAAKRGEDPVTAGAQFRMKRDRVGGRMAELAQKANTDPANMTPSEFKELKQLRAQAARSPSAA